MPGEAIMALVQRPPVENWRFSGLEWAKYLPVALVAMAPWGEELIAIPLGIGLGLPSAAAAAIAGFFNYLPALTISLMTVDDPGFQAAIRRAIPCLVSRERLPRLPVQVMNSPGPAMWSCQ